MTLYRLPELLSIGNTEKMNNFEKITNILKEKLSIKTDKELAETLGIKNTTFSERKRTNSIPHDEILKICISEKLDINEIYTENQIIGKRINFKEELHKMIEEIKEEKAEIYYHLVKAEILKENL